MKVQLFATCLIDSLFPEIGEAVVAILEGLGLRIEFPGHQTCCGQPAFNAGYWAEARSMAIHTLRVLSRVEGPVIIPSGSCAAMIRHGYMELFSEDPIRLQQAAALSRRCFEFSEFIVDQLGISRMEATYPNRLAYHPSCHLLRGLGVDRQPRSLLAGLRDTQVEWLPPDCCGFGGIFAIDHEPISSEMLRRRMGQVEACGAEVVVACDVGCLMHLEGGLRKAGSQIRCAHLSQVLLGLEAGLR